MLDIEDLIDLVDIAEPVVAQSVPSDADTDTEQPAGFPANTLLIDLSSMLHTALYRAKNGTAPGGVHNFLAKVGELLHEAITLCGPCLTTVLVCEDSKPYARSRLLSQYKKDRIPMRPEVREVFESGNAGTLELIQKIGIPSVQCAEAEADDVMADYTLRHLSEAINIWSPDSDLHFLHNAHPNLRQIHTKKGVFGLVQTDKEALSLRFPLLRGRLWLLPLYHAMTAGHNGAHKTPGLGPVSAEKFLGEVPDYVTDIYDAAEHILDTCWVTKILPCREYEKQITENLRLQTFPLQDLAMPEEYPSGIFTGPDDLRRTLFTLGAHVATHKAHCVPDQADQANASQ